LRLHSLFARRPSPALIISSLALFISLGGVGYAATQLPNGSVGSAQLQNNAVTYKKIVPGAVGNVRANLNQLQARVGGKCAAGPSGAIGAIDSSGKVTCNPTLPQEFAATVPATTLQTTSTPIQAVTLPAGSSFLVLANPQVAVTAPAAATVEIDCTLVALPSGNASQTRSATFTIGAGGGDRTATLPLTIAAPLSTSTSSAAVTCTKVVTTGTPAATVATSLNAIQTESNN
jgi:hypothetical protein